MQAGERASPPFAFVSGGTGSGAGNDGPASPASLLPGGCQRRDRRRAPGPARTPFPGRPALAADTASRRPRRPARLRAGPHSARSPGLRLARAAALAALPRCRFQSCWPLLGAAGPGGLAPRSASRRSERPAHRAGAHLHAEPLRGRAASSPRSARSPSRSSASR